VAEGAAYLERVETLYLLISPPYWFRHVIKLAKREKEVKAAPRLRPAHIAAARYHVIATDPGEAGVLPGPVTYEVDFDSPMDQRGEYIVHVDSYDTARAVERGKLLFFVDTTDKDTFLQSLEELAKLAARFGSRLILEFNKMGSAELNYTLCLLAYRLRVPVRDVSFVNIVNYIEGRSAVVGEYGPPLQLTLYAGRRFVCPHEVIYGRGDGYQIMSYIPCPAMRIESDPYLFLLKKIYPDLGRLVQAAKA